MICKQGQKADGIVSAVKVHKDSSGAAAFSGLIRRNMNIWATDLQLINLVISKRALHGAVGNAEAVAGTPTLGMGEGIHKGHTLNKVPCLAAHHLAQIVLREAL